MKYMVGMEGLLISILNVTKIDINEPFNLNGYEHNPITIKRTRDVIGSLQALNSRSEVVDYEEMCKIYTHGYTIDLNDLNLFKGYKDKTDYVEEEAEFLGYDKSFIPQERWNVIREGKHEINFEIYMNDSFSVEVLGHKTILDRIVIKGRGYTDEIWNGKIFMTNKEETMRVPLPSDIKNKVLRYMIALKIRYKHNNGKNEIYYKNIQLIIGFLTGQKIEERTRCCRGL
ncbi:hypothetical protein [Alkaliphilus sp. B6464]|uniref:hypothetical protein n=1 Tax=Alkaliphilus sp. B6464 TaxID=2731219 RepID=UPI001BAC76B5|nr:hypothetical protein [Alkaliphilus sp. B6464]QUH21916.1 hypothetical protein HYG84_18445 [Alkaliphilus sp. B6464]